jgi:hypothetical protein
VPKQVSAGWEQQPKQEKSKELRSNKTGGKLDKLHTCLTNGGGITLTSSFHSSLGE